MKLLIARYMISNPKDAYRPPEVPYQTLGVSYGILQISIDFIGWFMKYKLNFKNTIKTQFKLKL